MKKIEYVKFDIKTVLLVFVFMLQLTLLVAVTTMNRNLKNRITELDDSAYDQSKEINDKVDQYCQDLANLISDIEGQIDDLD